MSKAAIQQVSVPDTEWRELLKLSAQEGIPPEDLLQNALRRYLSEVRRIAKQDDCFVRASASGTAGMTW
ncbi:MAG: hypothetical protein FJ014_18955 [Chloroflexi bacterium]|nr:hypothetical protein [Chloroflexota bacterium]